MAIFEFFLAEKVNAGTVSCVSEVPPNGKNFRILEFYAESSADEPCSVNLIWIENHASETEDLLWTIRTSGQMPQRIKPKTKRTNADGIRKLSLCLNNGLATDIYMSAYVRFWVQD